MNKQTVVFRNGVPYALDHKKLDEQFPLTELTEGRKIPHVELAGILGIERGSRRYYGVINSWCGRLKAQYGLILAWEVGEGLRVLDDPAKLSRTETRTRQKVKQTGRAIREVAWINRERLDETGRARLDHFNRVAMAVKTFLDQKRHEFAVELGPVRSLPRPGNGK